MKNRTEGKRFSDKDVDLLMHKSLGELPRQVEESVKAAAQTDEQGEAASLDEARRQLLKEKIDLEIKRRSLEEERAQFEKRSRRNSRIKLAIASVAVLVLVLIVPMPAQGGKSMIDVIHDSLVGAPDTNLDSVSQSTDGDGELVKDEEEAWQQVETLLYAPRLRFPEAGDEWLFEEGEVNEAAKIIYLSYRLHGEQVFVIVSRDNNEKKQQRLNPGDSQRATFLLEGTKAAEAVLYVIENGEGQTICCAEITCGSILYLVDSGLEYEEFEELIRKVCVE